MLSYYPLTLLVAMALAVSVPNSAGRQISSREPHGCTETSMKALVWVAEDLHFHSSITFSTPAHQIVGGWVSFNLSNSALPYTMSCSASSTQLSDFFYGNQWFSCTRPGSIPSGYDASFQFDKAGGRLDVKQRWMCSDAADPIIFSAAGTANITLNCTTEKWQNPNWTMGAIYSTETVECALQDMTIRPSEIQAIA